MKNLLLYYFLFATPFIVLAQTKSELQKHIVTTLSYKAVAFKTKGIDCRVTVFQIEFNDCIMNYDIFKKVGDNIEKYTVRMLLSRIESISIEKNKEGFNELVFTTKNKSIIKEYGDGNLVYEKSQCIPLTAPDTKALAYFKRLKEVCENRK